MSPPIVNGDNGDPPYKAKSMFELWCDYDRSTKDAGAKALGLMVFKLFDSQQELRARSNRNWNAILTLSAITSFTLTVLVGHTFGVGV